MFPGPGAYNIRGDYDGPRWKFGKGPRAGTDPDDEPGPGQYDFLASVPDVPKYLTFDPKKQHS
jgi:hypothetical protein